ncbi:MAG TPA: hypothetical protein VM537_09915 [Anaerolineae bacterium]|nr:hypothetical protein [Anaerolineae bacterium]
MTLAQQKRRAPDRARLAIGSGLALAALFLLGAATPSIADQAISTVEQYLCAWQAGDTGRMYELLTDDAKEAVGPQEFAMAFTVRLPFTEDSYVVRPVRFDRVRRRADSSGVVDYRAVFTVESLLGPSASAIFCRDRSASLSLADLRRARMQALYLLYDQRRPDSPYVNIAYVLNVWGTLILKDILSFLPSDAPQQPDASILPRVGLEGKWELVVDTGAITMEPWEVSAAARPFHLGALEVGTDGRIALSLGTREQGSLAGPQLCEEDFNRLAWLMGLDWQ